MLYTKTNEEVELLRESNLLVSRTLGELASLIKPGITTLELDRIAEIFIRDNGAQPAFKGYNGFPKTLCTSVNDEVVHGIPSDYVLKEGDIISIDCGVLMNGFYGDSAYTFAVGEISDEVRRLLEFTRASLEEGVKSTIAGNRVGVVRELVGHGLGTRLHESPEVPNYGKRGTGPKLMKGMVICIEPMINMGIKETLQMRDGWTIKTADGKPSAHFEYAVAVDKGKADVLTTYKYIEEVLNKR
jgi:methionyl aminopeptidase